MLLLKAISREEFSENDLLEVDKSRKLRKSVIGRAMEFLLPYILPFIAIAALDFYLGNTPESFSLLLALGTYFFGRSQQIAEDEEDLANFLASPNSTKNLEKYRQMREKL